EVRILDKLGDRAGAMTVLDQIHRGGMLDLSHVVTCLAEAREGEAAGVDVAGDEQPVDRAGPGDGDAQQDRAEAAEHPVVISIEAVRAHRRAALAPAPKLVMSSAVSNTLSRPAERTNDPRPEQE